MNMDDLIFSKGRYRFLRHLIFWLTWLVFSSIVQLTNFKPGPIQLDELIIFQIVRSLSRIPSLLLFCYVTIYFLIPRFILTKRYLHFSFLFLLFVLEVSRLLPYKVHCHKYCLPNQYLTRCIQLFFHQEK